MFLEESMEYIKQLVINGFKKFESLQVDFQESTNIIVGENESGKSTILEAICIVLQQWYRNADKSVIKDLVNSNNVKRFKDNPSLDTLPTIRIELELELDAKNNKNARRFFGTEGTKRKKDTYGILFECKLAEEFDPEIATEIAHGKIPYEYYNLSWKTFHGETYNLLLKPFKSILVDATQYDGGNTFSSFSKDLFNEKYTEGTKTKARYDFRESVNAALASLELEPLSEEQCFGLCNKKLTLDNLISVFDNDIPLENKGRGMEHIIRTQIALDKARNQLNVVLIEEPENHLSYTNLIKMISQIEENINHNQLILTTHSNLIASRLNLRNVLWIDKEKAENLLGVQTKIAEYFMKADNNNFLNLLLASKVILVEGSAEFIILPYLFQQITGRTLEEEGITIVSCNGLAYMNYLAIAESAQKKVAVITDNDNKQSRITKATEYNSSKEMQRIFMPDDITQWTWEVCLYNLNQKMLRHLIEVKANADYSFCKVPYDTQPVLGKMLNNKAVCAYELVISKEKINVPEYVKEAFEWVRS